MGLLMKFLLSIAALLIAMGSVTAETLSTPVQCSRDSQGSQVCVGTQPDKSVCGTFHFQFPGGISHFYPLYCDDVVVQKTVAVGQTLYTRVLGGESDEIPKQFVFDAQDNVVLLGTTYSRQFP